MMAGSAAKKESLFKRVVINAFIIVHLYIIVFWGLPASSFRAMTTQPVQDYVIYTGLWHSWDMFSPDPLSLNFSVEAEVTFADGSKTVWEFPRMENLGLWEKFQKERYRKWRERVRQDAYSLVWTDTAQYIARLHDNRTNPPFKIELIRRWQPIPPPLMRFRTNAPATPRDFQPIPDKYDLKFNYRFKQYEVRPEDLR